MHPIGSAPEMPCVSTSSFTILIDNDCPLCRIEGRFLERLDRGRGRLRLIDIASPDYDAASTGVPYEQAMGEIHGLNANGETVTGMEVFRRAYAAVGWSWLWAPTGWSLLRPIFDFAYRVFAKHRLRLTGRPACETGTCRI